MKYDFDTPVDRRRNDAVKWNVKEGVLPMWVADMDFKAAPEILEDLQERLLHGVFGYGDVPEPWYDAYIGWWKERHGHTFARDELIFCTGVVPAISSIVRKLTTPNEKVVLLTPVYNIFFNSVVNNGARAYECPLRYENGEYSIDFPALETALSDPQTSLLLFCNPHNPVGRIYTREELARVGELAKRYRVTVISDEIHCDIVRPGAGYIPFASASQTCAEVCVTCVSPTKAFNLAGLQSACVAVRDPFLRHKVRRALNTDEVAEPNSFAVTAAVSAFTRAGAWLDALNAYLWDNRTLAQDLIRERMPRLRAVQGEATYLLWIDVSGVTRDSGDLARSLLEDAGLRLTPGDVYGVGGKGFLRLNLACPRSVLISGLRRLESGIKNCAV